MGGSILYYPPYKEITNNKDNMKINNEDTHLKNLLKIVGQTHANTNAVSINIGKFRLLQDLFNEIDELNLDNASRVKVRLWLDKHLNKTKAEQRLNNGC